MKPRTLSALIKCGLVRNMRVKAVGPVVWVEGRVVGRSAAIGSRDWNFGTITILRERHA